MWRTLLLLLAFATGCGPAPSAPASSCGPAVFDPLTQIIVDKARLDDLELWQAGLVLGEAQGRAVLHVLDTVGGEHTFDCKLHGRHYGLVAGASANATASYPLETPPGISARAIVDRYEGPHVGADVGVGFHWRELENPSGVKMNLTTLSFGLGATPVTWEEIELRLDDDPLDAARAAFDSPDDDPPFEDEPADDP
jgi:hypothetical protein